MTRSGSEVYAQIADPEGAQALQSGLAEHFRTPFVEVRIGSAGPKTYAQIVFNDSTFFSLSRPQRMQAARTVAEYVRDHYPRYLHLTTVLITWSVKGSDGGIETFMLPFEVGELHAIDSTRSQK
jgi:hypothetical protein